MAYVALYRKWRPQGFDALVGQEAVRTALTNALETGRIAHAYLFAGPRGTGKTSTAKILAKAVNCEHGPTPNPCNECQNCVRINDGTFRWTCLKSTLLPTAALMKSAICAKKLPLRLSADVIKCTSSTKCTC